MKKWIQFLAEITLCMTIGIWVFLLYVLAYRFHRSAISKSGLRIEGSTLGKLFAHCANLVLLAIALNSAICLPWRKTISNCFLGRTKHIVKPRHCYTYALLSPHHNIIFNYMLCLFEALCLSTNFRGNLKITKLNLLIVGMWGYEMAKKFLEGFDRIVHTS